MGTLIAKIATIIFIVESLTLLGVGFLPAPTSHAAELLITATVHMGLSVPLIYVWAVKPHAAKTENLHLELKATAAELEDQRLILEEQTEDVVYAAEQEALRNMELATEIIIDPLTGLKNRRFFETELPIVISSVLNTGNGVSLLFIDLDYFKSINDNLGHDAGDEVLKKVGAALSAIVRDRDTVCRIGGDEFLIALFHVKDPSIAIKKAEEVIAAMAKIGKDYEDRGERLGASIGICHTNDPGMSFESIIKHADEAMYEAKRGGRGRYVMC